MTNVIPIPEEHSSPSDGKPPIASPKAAKTGVSLSNARVQPEEHGEKRWYVIRATYNREKKGYDYIKSLGYEAYLPIQKKVVIIDGKEEIKEQTLIPNLIFVQTDPSGLFELLRENSASIISIFAMIVPISMIEVEIFGSLFLISRWRILYV